MLHYKLVVTAFAEIKAMNNLEQLMSGFVDPYAQEIVTMYVEEDGLIQSIKLVRDHGAFLCNFKTDS